MSQGTLINVNALQTTTVTAPIVTTPIGNNGVCGYQNDVTAPGTHVPNISDGKHNVVLAIGVMADRDTVTLLCLVVTAPFTTIHDQSTWDVYYDVNTPGASPPNIELANELKAKGAQLHLIQNLGNYEGGSYQQVQATTLTQPSHSFALQGLQTRMAWRMLRLVATFADINNPTSLQTMQSSGCCLCSSLFCPACPTVSDSELCRRNNCGCDGSFDVTCAYHNFNFNNGNVPSSPGPGWFINDILWQYWNDGTFGGVKFISAVTFVNLSQASAVVTPIEPFKCCTNTLSASGAYLPGTWEKLICENQGRIYGTDSCTTTITAACSQDMTLPACKTQCGASPPFNTFPCANIMNAYCDSKCLNPDGTAKSECIQGGTNSELQSLCGCYLNENFYTNYYNSLQSKVGGLPTAARKDCFYGGCGVAEILPDGVRAGIAPSCPAVQQCISVTNVDNSGLIDADNINIANNNICNFTEQTGTGTGSQTGTGTGTGTSAGGMNLSLIIGVILGAVVLVGIVIAVIAATRRSATPVAAPVAAARPAAYPYPYGAYPPRPPAAAYAAYPYGSPYAAPATPTAATPLTAPSYVPTAT